MTGVCRVCACTEEEPCGPIGCTWVEPDLCDHCAEFVMDILLWMSEAHTPQPRRVDSRGKDCGCGPPGSKQPSLRSLWRAAAAHEDAPGHVCLALSAGPLVVLP